MKKMPAGVSQLRISSNGGMRPPATPVVPSIPLSTQSSPPQVPPPPLVQLTNGINGTNQSPTRVPEGEVVKVETAPTSMPNGTSQSQHETNAPPPTHTVSAAGRMSTETSPVRPKSSQSTHLTVPIQNGYHIASVNGFSPMPNGAIYHANGQHNGLSAQQMQNLKSVFANAGQDLNTMHINGNRVYTGLTNGAHFNMQLPAGANMNLKLPSSRQPQWPVIPSPLQHTASLDSTSMNGSMSPSPGLSHAVTGQGAPIRTPSANGSRNGVRVPSHMMAGQQGPLGSMPISPYLHHSASPASNSQNQCTPPRPSPTPPMTMVSPSIQHQQMVGGSQSGY
jgi:enhancer of polycomb-like protein